MILSSAGMLVSPYILKVIIDEIIPSKELNYLIQILLILVGINIVRILIDFYSNYLYSWVSNHIMLDIRLELFNRILHFPLSFLDNNKTGDITHRINEEVNAVQGMLTGSLIRFIRNTITIVCLTIALCFLNYKLFVISIVVVPFTIINAKYFQPRIHNLIKKSREKDSDILGFFVEKFNNIKLIKIYNTYKNENEKLNSKGKELIDLNLEVSILSSGTQSITTFLISLSPLIILAWGGQSVIFGTMTIGSLIAFIQYLNRIFGPINDFMYLYWDLVRTSVSMKRIFEFLELPTEPLSYEPKNIDLNKNIVFEDIEFKYEEQIILKNFYLELIQGKIYAIVGTSGCGKSTIINLLCKFYNVEKGSITFGGKQIGDIDPHELRKRIGLISQDNQLFNDSILENIKYGKSVCSKPEIENVIKMVGLEDFLGDINNGVDMVIGNEGTMISGGQKQRISIARALLRNVDLIILDEATSALDSESECNILKNVINHYKSKTIIIISHRLSAIKHVDEIICLEGGRVVEKGNHEELIELKGVYWNLFSKQIV
jgi:ABC-type bacteriocin/lantibiotic exporter with double-glycine peptidase domain